MDLVLPFTLGGGAFRGRLVRLHQAATDTIVRHHQPEAVGRLIGEALVLAVAVGSRLKFDGVVTLQTSSDGPVSRIVADMTSNGDVRASVATDPERLAEMIAGGEPLDFAHLAGKGHLALTVDQGETTDRYQGIVAIEGRSLADTAISYFRQSEQIGTALLLAAEAPEGGFGWRAGGILLQRLPTANATLTGPEEADAWETAKVLLQSLTDRELLDPTLAATEVLRRLFHQSDLVVYDGADVRFACRCSRQRLEGVLAGLPPEDLEHAAKDGTIEVTCDFCKTRYIFDINDIPTSSMSGDIPSKPRSE